jgi:hypothetical protein
MPLFLFIFHNYNIHSFNHIHSIHLSIAIRRGFSPWCGVAQLIAHRLVVSQARVRFSARHHREIFPTELTSDEEM